MTSTLKSIQVLIIVLVTTVFGLSASAQSNQVLKEFEQFDYYEWKRKQQDNISKLQLQKEEREKAERYERFRKDISTIDSLNTIGQVQKIEELFEENMHSYYRTIDSLSIRDQRVVYLSVLIDETLEDKYKEALSENKGISALVKQGIVVTISADFQVVVSHLEVDPLPDRTGVVAEDLKVYLGRIKELLAENPQLKCSFATYVAYEKKKEPLSLEQRFKIREKFILYIYSKAG